VASVRALCEADLDGVMRLAAETPAAPHWERAAYESFLAVDGQRRLIFVAEDDGHILGFVAAQVVMDVCELESIAVAAVARRSGVGRTLLATLIEWARQQGLSRMHLEVRAGNNSAIGFYSRVGFGQDGMRRGYYHSPKEDAVLMSLALEPVSKM